MGSAHAKILPADVPASPTSPVSPTPTKLIYTLPFTFSVIVDDSEQEDEAIALATGHLNESYTWRPYLQATMRDAWLLERQKDIDYEDPGPRADRLPTPPNLRVKHISVRLHPGEDPNTWAGDVRWISSALPLTMIERAVHHRIGYWMSSFEIQDHGNVERPCWYSALKPGPLSVTEN